MFNLTFRVLIEKVVHLYQPIFITQESTENYKKMKYFSKC